MPTILDLFSGCGGLTLGSKQAGFSTPLAVDIDPILTSSFATNFPEIKILHEDVRSLSNTLLNHLLPSGVTGVVGGPPCQGFSGIGKQSPDDPRRSLLNEFFRIVQAMRPHFFLMENVPGLGFKSNIESLNLAMRSLEKYWEIIGPVTLDAADFGAPTKRKRLFVFGFDPDKMIVPTIEQLTTSENLPVTVKDAIFDLAKADLTASGIGVYNNRVKVSEYARGLRSPSGTFSGHQFTTHKPHIVERFANLSPGEIDRIGKHKRLEWAGLCPTLRAGTGSDRGSFQAVRPIHPDQPRVITPREAARLQGFPDSHVFHETIWHSFRMIGNSVSPVIARALLSNIRGFISL